MHPNDVSVLRRAWRLKGRDSVASFALLGLSYVFLTACAVSLDTVLARYLGKNAAVVSGIWFLTVAWPVFALFVRRLHDTGRSGWTMLWVLVPFVGVLVLLFRVGKSGDVGENKYGPEDPGLV